VLHSLTQGLGAQYPPSGGRGAVVIGAEDMEFLEPEAFLNDTVLDFYIK
jgi:Ulp1 family protease